MNEFTSNDPEFPYQSREATEQLGIPDSPEIHLAITELAAHLLQQTEGSPLEHWQRRVVALRTASGAALFGWSLELTERELRINAELNVPAEMPEEVKNAPRRNWLADAAAKLREEGIFVPAAYQRQRSAYGWRHLDEGTNAAAGA